MVRDPSALPIELGIMVAKGTSGYVKIWGDKVLPTARLIRVTPEKRFCLYPHEKKFLGRGYLRSNCLFNCYARFMYHDCGCVPSFNYFQYDSGIKLFLFLLGKNTFFKKKIYINVNNF